MMNVQDCLLEVIAKGPGYVIRSAERAGIDRKSEWEPAALLADIQQESPLLLVDHAWTEWVILADGSQSCAIVYGIRGGPPGERAVLGYGSLHAFELRHKQRDERGDTSLTKGIVPSFIRSWMQAGPPSRVDRQNHSGLQRNAEA